MKIEFDEKSHTYTIDGEVVMGVTSVLDMFPKGWLVGWSCKMMAEHILSKLKGIGETPSMQEIESLVLKGKTAWREKRDSAADTGTDIHAIFEDIINGKVVTVKDDISKCVDQFFEFQKKYKPKWIATEQIVGHKELRYCGTFDALAEIEGKVYLIDFKTSTSVKDSFSIQLLAYKKAHESMGKTPKVDKMAVLWTPKEGDKYEFVVYDKDEKLEWELFKSALMFCNHFKIWDSMGKKYYREKKK